MIKQLSKMWIVIIGMLMAAPVAAGETVVEVASRGVKVRALQELPDNPVASVILLAGGGGDLRLSESGAMGDLSGNQLVRTRHLYAAAGLAVLTPDLGPGIASMPRYRTVPEHAEDLGALVEHMRAIAQPVVVVGTSRGTLSAATVVVRQQGARRPDAMVLTSAFLALTDGLTVYGIASGRAESLALPALVMGHEADGCRETPAANIAPFRQWLAASGKPVEVKVMRGGITSSLKADPCGANSAHGFLGLDPEVVAATADWVKALPR